MGLLWWNTSKAVAEAEARMKRGLEAAAIVLVNRVKEKISKPAPRKLVRSRKGTPYYRATVPATPGAPPRKLSGALRKSVTYEIDGSKTTRVFATVVYGMSLERQGHYYLSVTMPECAWEMKAAMKRAMGGL